MAFKTQRLDLGNSALALTMLFIFAFLFFFLLLPIGTILTKALVTNEGSFTLSYFELFWQNESYIQSLLNSFKIAFATTFVTILISFPLALANSRLIYFGKGLFSCLLLIPLVLPPFVAAVGVNKIFAKFGAFNLFLYNAGLMTEMIDWMHSDHLMFVVVVLEALHLYPIIYLNILAAIANIDPSLEEAASVLGASRLSRYRRIILPLSKPGIFAGASVVFVFSFTDLGTPLLVGYTESIAVKIFDLVTSANANPLGYAIVLIVLAIVTLCFALSKLFAQKHSYQMLAKGHVQRIEERPGFLGQGLLIGFNILLIGAASIPHLSILLSSVSESWFMSILPSEIGLDHYENIFHEPISVAGIKNSLFLAGLATLVDIALGFVIAFIISRRLAGPLTGWLDALVMMPLAVPGIVLAFGYVVCYSDTFLDPLENPVWLLIMAYSMRRLPYMVRAASAGLSQMSKNLEEASYTLGAGRWKTLYRISLPLVFANVLAGAIFCFSFAMLDVSDSLILAMKDKFYPLTKAIYALYLEQGRGENLASALGSISMLILAAALATVSVVLGKKMGELFRS